MSSIEGASALVAVGTIKDLKSGEQKEIVEQGHQPRLCFVLTACQFSNSPLCQIECKRSIKHAYLTIFLFRCIHVLIKCDGYTHGLRCSV